MSQLSILRQCNQDLQLLWSKAFKFLQNICIIIQLQEPRIELHLLGKRESIDIAVSDIAVYGVSVTGTGRFNGEKLLQNRKLFLEYSYANEAGNTVTVKDTLSFRNRYRDGVNEWQDENPENYK